MFINSKLRNLICMIQFHSKPLYFIAALAPQVFPRVLNQNRVAQLYFQLGRISLKIRYKM